MNLGSAAHAVDGNGLVCTVDRRATDAGLAALISGGSAADAAIAANAVLAVTCPHLCGMGGDLWAIVDEPGRSPVVLNAAGRAGGGVDATRLRARGDTQMPMRGDLVSVPVPGCVDGWLALSERYGRLGLDEVFDPAMTLATDGFAASPLLALSAILVDHLDVDGIGAELREGDTVRRPGVADAMCAVARDGRDGFYQGAFGQGLLRMGAGVFTQEDLRRVNAQWFAALGLEVFGRRIWTAPPGSQGYLILATLHVAEALGLPDDDSDPGWFETLVAAAVVTGADRPSMLHEHADGEVLLGDSNLSRWVDAARRWLEGPKRPLVARGDTTYLCVRDRAGMAVSLIQSNAADYGAHLVEPATGIYLHNRGVGFSLEPGHPAELAPGARPPSTLSPVLVTDRQGDLVAIAGTMGGDSQPQLMAQHLSRLLHSDLEPAAVLDAPRWVLRREGGRGFDLWNDDADATIGLVTDRGGLDRWSDAASELCTRLEVESWRSPTFGHAHLIARDSDGWIGRAEPRVRESAAGVAESRASSATPPY